MLRDDEFESSFHILMNEALLERRVIARHCQHYRSFPRY
jgi:hypothetical protein